MQTDFTISDYRAAVRSGKYVFPGGGETYYLCSDGGILCSDCAYTERRNILEAMRDNHNSGGWRVVAVGNTYNEDPQERTCDHCGADIGDQGDTLTAEDIAHLETEVRRRQEDNARDPSDPDYDEGGPEPVMTSIGYVDVWIDGDCIQNGTTIYTVE